MAAGWIGGSTPPRRVSNGHSWSGNGSVAKGAAPELEGRTEERERELAEKNMADGSYLYIPRPGVGWSWKQARKWKVGHWYKQSESNTNMMR